MELYKYLDESEISDNSTKANRRYGKITPQRRSVIFLHTGLSAWQLGRVEVICRHGFIVVWCNKWEFGAMGFDRIPYNPILYIMEKNSELRKL